MEENSRSEESYYSVEDELLEWHGEWPSGPGRWELMKTIKSDKEDIPKRRNCNKLTLINMYLIQELNFTIAVSTIQHLTTPRLL